jgi:HPt (histidine-containing phosphotransfer) domain-containing protein
MDAFLGKPIVVEELAAALGSASAFAAPAVPEPDVRVLTSTVVDASVLRRLRGQIGHENVLELAELYVSELRAGVDHLMDSCAAQDRELLSGTAHKLKSGSRALGAVGLGRVFEQIEDEGPSAGWEQLAALVAVVQAQRVLTEEQLQLELAPS